jgi:hypothetical protein
MPIDPRYSARQVIRAMSGESTMAQASASVARTQLEAILALLGCSETAVRSPRDATYASPSQ